MKSPLFHQEAEQAVYFVPIGLIPHGQFKQAVFFIDALAVAECLKTVDAVIGSHTALANPAKGQLVQHSLLGFTALSPSHPPAHSPEQCTPARCS